MDFRYVFCMILSLYFVSGLNMSTDRRSLSPKFEAPQPLGGGRRVLAPKVEASRPMPLPKGPSGRRVLAPKVEAPRPMPLPKGPSGRRVLALMGIKGLPKTTDEHGRRLEKDIKEDLYGKSRGSGRRTLMEGIKELPPN